MDPINVGILEEIAHAGNKEEKQKTWNTKKMAQYKAEPLRTATAWEKEKNQQDIADMIQANANIYLVALKALSMLEANGIIEDAGTLESEICARYGDHMTDAEAVAFKLDYFKQIIQDQQERVDRIAQEYGDQAREQASGALHYLEAQRDVLEVCQRVKEAETMDIKARARVHAIDDALHTMAGELQAYEKMKAHAGVDMQAIEYMSDCAREHVQSLIEERKAVLSGLPTRLEELEANASDLKKVIRNLKAKGADTTSAEAMLQETRQNMEKENAFHYEHIS